MNTAPIKPLKKTSEAFLRNFFVGLLGLVTLGFAAPYIYKKRNIANLNTMSRVALGSEVEGVKFAANYMYVALIAFWFPIPAFALFSSAITLLPITLPFTIPISANVIIPVLGISVVSGLILMWYMLKIVQDIKTRLLQIAVNYGRSDVISLYLNDVGFFGSNREKLNQRAYNKLVDEHNARIQNEARETYEPNPQNSRQTYYSSYQPNEGADESDYYSDNDYGNDDFRANDSDYASNVENSSADIETPFEILGVSETASESEVKAAYRQKCILWHPDKLTPEQRNDPKFSKIVNDEMSRINNAYEQIKQRKGWK